MRLKHQILWLLTMMLVVGTQRAWSDGNQPRFMIPTSDFSDPQDSPGCAVITPGNPFFTIYLWHKNEDGKDTYWAESPTLTIDGHSVQLTKFASGTYDWTCKDANGNVYYYVHSHSKSIIVGEDGGAVFRAQFPDAINVADGDQDRYMGLDIYIYDNYPGQVHTIKARGKLHADAKVGSTEYYIDVKTLGGSTELKSGKTKFPFTDAASKLEWTAPGKLTMTTGEFDDKSWGNYQLVVNSGGFIGASDAFKSGSTTFTCSTSNPNYRKEDPITVEYRYSGNYKDKYHLLFHENRQHKPTSLSYPVKLAATSYDPWQKTVTLDWDFENLKAQNSDGIFYLRRGNDVVYTTTSLDLGPYTDRVSSYDTNYSYSATFIPIGWPSGTIEEQLTSRTTVNLERDFVVNDPHVDVNGGGYNISWTASKYLGSQKTYYRLYRKVVTASDAVITFDESDKLAEIEATSSTSYSYQDNNVNTTDTYAYMLKVNAQEKEYQTQAVQPSGRLDGSKLTRFAASRGTYTDRVTLKWSADVKGNDNMVYVIKRHTIDNSGIEQYSAPNAYIVLDTLKDDATTRHTSYTDTKMLSGYYYVYKIEGLVNGSKTAFTTQMCDGFARSTATVTGNVTYNSAGRTIGVEGVRMNFESDGNDGLKRSLRCPADSCGLLWEQDNVILSNYFDNHPFSLQMYVRPDGGQTGEPCLMDMRGVLRLGLCDGTSDGYRVSATVGGQTYKSSHRVRPDVFTSLTFTYDGKGSGCLMLVDTIDVVTTDMLFTNSTIHWVPTAGYEGRVAVFMDADQLHSVRGYVDEVRFFKRQLTSADVLQNYNRLMGGSERGLIAYWPLDENIDNIFRAYDCSSTDGHPNENHALIVGGTRSKAVTPTDDQLSLHAITDTLGYYALQGIPFSGEGNSYRITPTKGTHDFAPDYRTIYVSQESLTFQPQNFTDKSSFNVKGKVYYENTLYPVKGCSFLVDSVRVTDKYGKVIVSDENGEFNIPVSIGQHFIYIEKEGHVFANNGRWPETGLINVNDSVWGLTFTDQTKAVIAGRIVGGSVEQGKPLGLGQSKGNVGVATLTLQTSSDVKDAVKMNVKYDKDEGIYYDNTDSLEVANANPKLVMSKAWVGGATGLLADTNIKTITIKTDSTTGEFAVLLPPVPYYVQTKVDHNTEASSAIGTKQLLDASDIQHTDTATVEIDKADGTTEVLTFVYNTSFMPTYNAVPNISVTQRGSDPGVFGEDRVPAGELGDTVNVWHVATDPVTHVSSVVYDYGYPIFTKGSTYEFVISSFERYLNYDLDPVHPEPYDQPSSAGKLTISNPMTLIGDTIANVPLDELGLYTYKFQALEPNVEPPYTMPLSISLHIGDNVTPWCWDETSEDEAMPCAVFSAKLTGDAFVTKAPDELVNILRDPFGSSSSLSWSAGSTTTVSYTRDISWEGSATSELDGATSVGDFPATGAPGLYVFNGMSVTGDRTRGFEFNLSLGNNENVTRSFSSNVDYSTSSEKALDGADGDVFIGVSTSLTYGDGRQVMLVNNQQGGYVIGTKDVIVTGESITGDFIYSQSYIENGLIPTFRRLRQARMRLVSQAELENYRQHYTNPSDSVIYMTSLTPDDPRFGCHNKDSLVWGNDTVLTWRADSMAYWGNSYTVFKPQTYKSADEEWDAIAELTSQIEDWQAKLSDNEQAKVKALQASDAYYRNSYSFDSGATGITFTQRTDTAGSVAIKVNPAFNKYRKYKLQTKKKLAENEGQHAGAFEWHIKNNRSHNLGKAHSESSTYTMSLQDRVADNYHSVERYVAPDGFSWIFRQTGGATSQNYEPALYTKYYQPGTKISEGTVQVEVPHIYCPERVKTNVDPDAGAEFNLVLTNATQANVTKYINFALQVVQDKWATMASVTMNDQPMPENISGIYLAPHDTAKVRLLVKPANNSVVHIDSLHISFYSDGQWTISDDIYLTAHFLPQAEKVKLMANRNIVNTSTDSTLTLTANGYSMDSSILNAVRLQQCKVGAADWTTIHSWVKGTPHGDTESPLTAQIDTLIDMHNRIAYPDATYAFRAITDCTVAGQNIIGASDTVKVIKDVTLPQPMAQPEPTDGVFGVGDEISVTFNEDIYSQSLAKDANFIIQSVLNTDSIAHEVALRLDGTETPAAASQTGLTLGNTSFTVCTWLKHNGTGGTILRHGEGADALRINVEADGHLTAFIIGEDGKAHAYTSLTTIPQDQWVYLGVTYDYEAGTLSARYASGDNEKVLMTGVDVGTYATSQGKLYLGENLTGAMHELSLYSTALTWTAIQQQMYTGKSHTTPSLIGYWRLDEGHGTTSEDLARSRHMQIASANDWYMENENIALALDGTSYAAIPLGNISAAAVENYLLEMWVKNSEASATPTLFSLDHGQKLDMNIVDGKLQMVVDSVTYKAAHPAFAAGEWHHVALNVLRGTSAQTNLIVDGTLALTIASDKVPALAGAYLYLGRNLKGALDEVRLWHGTNTADAIAERMYYRVDGKTTTGLVGYYPMERSYYDDYHQRVFSFSPDNQAAEATDATALVTALGGSPAETIFPATPLASTAQTIGLKSAPHKSNLDFHFVADERTVSIFLDHSAAALEGCNVTTTLRSYYDLHDNVGAPITWTFDVKQNPLLWETTEVNETIGVGQQGTFTVTLSNTGVKDQRWAMNDVPSWLKVSPTSGTVQAHGSQKITFTVLSGKPIGHYFTTVSARTSDHLLDTPLDICLSIEGERPNWTPVRYSESMTVVGQIKIDGITSTDTGDMVGAFINDGGVQRCVGTGQPKYNTTRDAYYVQMLVSGSMDMQGSPVSFRLYDASTGKTYPLTTATPFVTFEADGMAGNMSNPVIWENEDKQLETEHLMAGWTAMSLYLDPDTKDQHLFDALGDNVKELYVNSTTKLTRSNGRWSDNYSPIKPGQMMKINLANPDTLYVIGATVDPADWPQTIKPGSNWVGVPTQAAMTIDEAFAGLSPEEGDVVKNDGSLSIFDNGHWDGDIESILPGRGYTYTSMAAEDKTLVFPNTAASGLTPYHTQRRGVAANFKYRNNMVAICTVHDDGFLSALGGSPAEAPSFATSTPAPITALGGSPAEAPSSASSTPSPAALIEAYNTSGELLGRSFKGRRDSIYFLVISNETEGEPIVLKAHLSDDRTLVRMLPQGFRADALVGTLRAPFVIDDSSNGIATPQLTDGELAAYTTSGILLYHGPASSFKRRRLTTAEPIIVVKQTTDGRTEVYKLK